MWAPGAGSVPRNPFPVGVGDRTKLAMEGGRCVDRSQTRIRRKRLLIRGLQLSVRPLSGSVARWSDFGLGGLTVGSWKGRPPRGELVHDQVLQSHGGPPR